MALRVISCKLVSGRWSPTSHPHRPRTCPNQDLQSYRKCIRRNFLTIHDFCMSPELAQRRLDQHPTPQLPRPVGYDSRPVRAHVFRRRKRCNKWLLPIREQHSKSLGTPRFFPSFHGKSADFRGRACCTTAKSEGRGEFRDFQAGSRGTHPCYYP